MKGNSCLLSSQAIHTFFKMYSFHFREEILFSKDMHTFRSCGQAFYAKPHHLSQLLHLLHLGTTLHALHIMCFVFVLGILSPKRQLCSCSGVVRTKPFWKWVYFIHPFFHLLGCRSYPFGLICVATLELEIYGQ